MFFPVIPVLLAILGGGVTTTGVWYWRLSPKKRESADRAIWEAMCKYIDIDSNCISVQEKDIPEDAKRAFAKKCDDLARKNYGKPFIKLTEEEVSDLIQQIEGAKNSSPDGTKTT